MLIGEGQDWLYGEEQAWEIISRFTADDVCCRAKAGYDEKAGHYILPVFNDHIFVSPEDRLIQGNSAVGKYLLTELPQYSRLSVLWYLIGATDISLSDRLISPREVEGGLIFDQGSHQLPLDRIAERYGTDVQGFLKRGVEIGAEKMDYGDCSIRLFPFPRVPVLLVLWKADDEFTARVDILFDSTCSSHLPTDIIWSTAMMIILVMLK